MARHLVKCLTILKCLLKIKICVPVLLICQFNVRIELFGYSLDKTPVKALAVLHVLDDHAFLTEAVVCHEVYLRADWKCIYCKLFT